ncbi:aminoglycoside phosphotransferase family protein [Maribellus sp. YY47]|uniref:phosphotransferase enzyme family protein n=1 Tax=Maribellus sp. YY47 TaxID=2929486 RepID=UPI0020019184|nr:aminoglycoside phosphotransferase family protein [Maribellus sp. YY47]MCK3685071.1 aminoglycoside phosphotransferase family protein [Maribellus sp. YY47]
MNYDLTAIARNFELEGEIREVKPLGEGFINDTFIIETVGDAPNYILQRKNKNIFSPIPAMMDNIQKVCLHIKKKVEQAGGDPMREAMTIIPATDGKLYYLDSEEEYWAVCMFIDDTIAYEAAETPELAYAGGKGIGKFQSLVADLKEPLVNILPGFHDIRYRFKQWDEVLSKDPVGRKAQVAEEISWIEDRKEEMLNFWKMVEDGTIPTRISHNDTKINNILFNKKGDVLCVIDLDTVLSSTVLNDFGDAMRFYTNTGLEDDVNLDNVSMDLEIYKAFAKGYLEEAASFLTEKEREYLAFSAKYITYEQVLRFLMDYIDGDNYYKVKSPEHNLIRTRAQYKLLQSMEEQYEQMKQAVTEFAV